LKEAGANNIYLYITHCETTIFDGEMINSGLITGIYTTDSIFPEDKQNDIIKIIK
jgi:ribose-phosphate pyrophosphokinase